MISQVKQLPPRNRVRKSDTWDLSSLYPNDAAWEKEMVAWERRIPKFEKFRGTLADGPKALAACLKFQLEFERTGERLGTYVFLKTTEDTTNSTYQGLQGRYINVASRAGQEASFIEPEILAIPDRKLDKFLADRALKPYRLLLERQRRNKPHTLSDREERLLAMQTEMSSASNQIFRALNDADLKFGTLKDEHGERVELSHGSFSTFLHSPQRRVRRAAFHQYYEQFQAHANTLAATLTASIRRDVYYAQARNFPSALERALFPDRVPVAVYSSLIEAVRRHLPAVHRYYDLRRHKMRLRDIHAYDTYVPIVDGVERTRDWREAVDLVVGALKPLGRDYTDPLKRGLNGRWCDRYENQGKQSGAFSCGSFDGEPYILMNYQPKVLDHVFTLAHEGGHSMHSYLSARNQPFAYYDYTIFVAEVASTFNEQLLSKYLFDRAEDDRQRAFLINREIDNIRSTIVRQTMFAEFEKITHEMAEANEPLTLDSYKSVYRELLSAYLGPDFAIDDELELECLRIPHFYRAFYVYKYATGMSAAIALANRVLSGGRQELTDYLGFLKGGCSEYPLDLLRGAGVDMERPEPVETALTHFGNLVDQLDELL